MKFSAIAKGTRARKPVPFPLRDGPLPLPQVAEDGTVSYPNDDSFVLVDVRVLTSDEASDALASARASAIAKGLKEPKDGDPVYDLAVMAHIIAASCIDHDSPESSPQPFFDGGVDQVKQLDRDRMALLYEFAISFQAECSPRRNNLSPEQYVGYVMALAVAKEDLPFDVLPLALQRSLLRSMAKQLFSSPTPKSPSSSD